MKVNYENLPPAYQGDEPYVFISYSHVNQEKIVKTMWEMHKRGVRFWYDAAIQAGNDWKTVVKPRLEKAAVVVFFYDKNFYTSEALLLEVRTTIELKKQYFSILYEGYKPNYIYGLALIDMENSPLTEAVKFYADNKVFSEDVISIIKTNETKDYIDRIVAELKKFNVVDSEIISVRQRQLSKKYCVLATNSPFSKLVISGMKDEMILHDDGILEQKLIDRNSFDINHNIVSFIKDNIDVYDGFIIRPVGHVDKYMYDVIAENSKTKDFVLFDIDLDENQRKQLGNDAPYFVCSDQQRGGMILADRVCRYAIAQGVSDVSILVCDASREGKAIKKRTEAFIATIVSRGLAENMSIVQVSNLDHKRAATQIENGYKTNLSRMNKSLLVIFCGNDNVAVELSKRIQSTSNEFASLIRQNHKALLILGYDGNKSEQDESVLSMFKSDFATIDTRPYEQGKTIIKACFGDMNRDKTIMVRPSLLARINIKAPYTRRAEIVERVVEGKKAYIFDLDGTIADTETLHWEAYNRVLVRYGVRLEQKNIRKYIGNPEIKIYDMIENDFGIQLDKQGFLEERIKEYLKLVEERNLQPYEWLQTFIKDKRDSGEEFYMLTSQIPEVVDILLRRWGMDKLFAPSRRISVHDAKITKYEVFSNPSKYLKEGLEIEDIAVFEDSDSVMQIAKQFGYIVVGAAHKYNHGTNLHADIVVDDKYRRGLYIGLCGLDIIYDIKGAMPIENSKLKVGDFSFDIGGPAAKAAITCAKLGGDATLVTCIGNSILGQYLKTQLSDAGVKCIDIALLSEHFKNPNVSSIFVNRQNSSRTIISGQSDITDLRFDTSVINEDYDYCLYDINLPALTIDIINVLKTYRIPLVLDLGKRKENAEYAISYADTAIASSAFVSENGEDIIELAPKLNVTYAAKTQNDEDVICLSPLGKSSIKVNKVTNCNTLGAGDVMHGAYCYYRYHLGDSFEEALAKSSEYATEYVKTNNR